MTNAQTGLRVVVAHDYLTQTGGAERVTLAMLQGIPGSRLVTSAYVPEETFPGFRSHEVSVIPTRGLRVIERDVRLGLPILARAFSSYVVDSQDADVVICSSSGWAHHITSRVPKLVYCHNPPRWLYQTDDYLSDQGRVARAAQAVLRRRLLRQDAAAARSSTAYLANSKSVAQRLYAAYGVSSRVLHPPVQLDPKGLLTPVEGVEPGYFLVVARKRGYKNTSAVMAAAKQAGVRLVVVGADIESSSPGIRSLGRVDDATLRWLYKHARATVGASFEDFGLTPLESNMFGTPVIALRAGGYLETVVEGATGIFFDVPDPESIGIAMHRLSHHEFIPADLQGHASAFSTVRFIEQLTAIAEALVGAGSTRLSDR